MVDELIDLVESGRGSQEDLERLQIKLNMVHETQTQAAHLTYEDMKNLKLVTAEEVLKPEVNRRGRTMRITFEEMPVVWPLGVKERFIRKMVEYDHSKGDYILDFFGHGVVEASGVRLIFSSENAEKVRKLYFKHEKALAASLDLSIVQ